MTDTEKALLLEKYIAKAKEEFYRLIEKETEDFGGEGQHYLHVVTENLMHVEEKLCKLKAIMKKDPMVI